MVLAAIVVGRYADLVLPVEYLVRPLVVAAVLAAVIGMVSLVAGSWAAPAASGLALIIGLGNLTVALCLSAVILAIVLLRKRGRLAAAPETAILEAAGIFLVLGSIRAVGVTTLPTTAGYDPTADGPPMVVIMLDGYPRSDTLAGFGFDNEPFLAALDARGFDRYPESRSAHVSTHRTLQALLTDEVVTDEPIPPDELRAIRLRLTVPPGFVEIDPPVGFVTMNAGPHIPTVGPTDFEADLIGQSVLGTLAPDWAWIGLMAGLRGASQDELDLVATTDAPRAFAHLMTPHPPFFYANGGEGEPSCWPPCGLYAHTFEEMGISRDAWDEGMRAQVAALNDQLLRTIDRVLDRHPDAVIVLFSDHGGRADTTDIEELHRSFLAARTPGHPGLYAAKPAAEDVIRTLLGAYGSN